jgi:hypothetical protein
MTVTIHLTRSSRNVWVGFMLVSHEDKIAEYKAEHKKVAGVLFALAQELVKHDLATRAIVTPEDLLPTPPEA